MGLLALFLDYIIGDFDNRAQIEAERQAGTQRHPAARHVNRNANAKIRHLPADFQGVFVIEESYYVTPDGRELLAPHLFLFEETAEGQVRLISYELPAGIVKADFRNDNPDLVLDYPALTVSKTFTPLTYEYDPAHGFWGQSVTSLPNGAVFTLTETIGPEGLDVMELMEKGGQRLTSYETPILYRRSPA